MDESARLDGTNNNVDGPTLLDLLIAVAEQWKLLFIGPILIGLSALAITYLIPSVYTARTLILPPPQQGTSITAALQSLGPLAGLAGAAGGLKNPADQYVALMQSTTLVNRVIDAHKLKAVYKSSTLEETRQRLMSHVRFGIGKKDGLITIEVDDEDPLRSADIANEFVTQLHKLTNDLTLTEAQQRRSFFERQLASTKSSLAVAQGALQGSGINEGALRAEPRAAADSYASLRAQVTAAEVTLQSVRSFATEQSQEYKRAWMALVSLRAQLAKVEAANSSVATGDYISLYREFKYQESLFELFSKQYELARLDESREGPTIQVVDVASAPERRSYPQRTFTAVVATLLGGFMTVGFILLRAGWKALEREPANAIKLERLRVALRGKHH